MTHDLQKPLPKPMSEIPAVKTTPASSKPKKSSSNLFLVLVLVFVAGISSYLILTAILAATLPTKLTPVETVLDAYMNYMEAKDVGRAYALLSPLARKEIRLATLEEWTEGDDYLLFKGYENLSVQSIQMTYSSNINSNSSQGTADVSGNVTYEDGSTGTISGTLELIDGKWRIDSLSVHIPADQNQP